MALLTRSEHRSYICPSPLSFHELRFRFVKEQLPIVISKGCIMPAVPWLPGAISGTYCDPMEDMW